MSMNRECIATVESLINGARQDRGSELGHLLEYFRPALTELARQEIRDELTCRMSQSDLVQDTMLTASRDFPAFLGRSESEFRRWIFDIFKSRLVDGLRRHRVAERRRQQVEVQISSQFVNKTASASELAALREDAANLLSALEQLPEEYRDILRKRYFEDMKFEAIAAARGVSIATVWRRWSEAIVLLKRAIGDSSHVLE